MKYKLIKVRIYATFFRKEVNWGMRTIGPRLLLDNIFQIHCKYTQQQVHHAGKEVLLKIKIKKENMKMMERSTWEGSLELRKASMIRGMQTDDPQCTDEKHQNRDTYIYTHPHRVIFSHFSAHM